MSGAVSYHSGLAAEDSVARHYTSKGHEIAAQRWRSSAGEIDLIAKKDGNVIFIEVKKSRDFGRAAQMLSRRQMTRIFHSAEVYLGQEPNGLDSDARFDVALVNGQGDISIIENVYCA